MADQPLPPHDFAGFYRATLAPLRRYLGRLLGSPADAQDVAHDAYARVYPAMQERPVARPNAFLYTTARRLAVDRLRRRSRAPFLPSIVADGGSAPSGAPAVTAVVMAREEWALLERAIADLPPGCRRVLLLRMVERLSHAEIAARLGLARSSVEKHLMRAVRLLEDARRSAESGGGGKVVALHSRTGTDGR